MFLVEYALVAPTLIQHLVAMLRKEPVQRSTAYANHRCGFLYVERWGQRSGALCRFNRGADDHAILARDDEAGQFAP